MNSKIRGVRSRAYFACLVYFDGVRMARWKTISTVVWIFVSPATWYKLALDKTVSRKGILTVCDLEFNFRSPTLVTNMLLPTITFWLATLQDSASPNVLYLFTLLEFTSCSVSQTKKVNCPFSPQNKAFWWVTQHGKKNYGHNEFAELRIGKFIF